MGIIERLEETMNLEAWPHTFAKDGKEVQVGMLKDGSGKEYDPIFAVPMICTHCGAKYLNGKENRPPDPCPARNKNREMKRLLS